MQNEFGIGIACPKRGSAFCVVCDHEWFLVMPRITVGNSLKVLIRAARGASINGCFASSPLSKFARAVSTFRFKGC